jgi:hypothetical protein
MSDSRMPTVDDIQELFERDITRLEGRVTASYPMDEQLYMRAVLPHCDTVRSRDEVRGGVALRVTFDEISIHPYTFRKVCRNGAVLARITDTCRLQRVPCDAAPGEIDEVLSDVSAAIQSAGDPAVFQQTVSLMRKATTVDSDLELFLSIAAAVPGGDELVAQFLSQIMRRVERGRDRSAFGLVNAVTSLARDTRDPAQRWRLEELGGGILAWVDPRPKPGSLSAQAIAPVSAGSRRQLSRRQRARGEAVTAGRGSEDSANRIVTAAK